MKELNANEVVRALRISADGQSCADGKCSTCPGDKLRDERGCCDDGIQLAAADLIESMQDQLADAQRRESAAVEDLKKSENRHGCCEFCKWTEVITTSKGEARQRCKHPVPGKLCGRREAENKWEWRGPVAGEESR